MSFVIQLKLQGGLFFLAIRFFKVIALIRLLQTLTLYRLVCFYYNLPPFYIKKLPFGFLFAERAVFYIPSGAFIFQSNPVSFCCRWQNVCGLS